MIPRRLFWLLDLLTLAAAFILAYLLVPTLQPLFLPAGALYTDWIQRLLSPALWDGQLPPLPDLLWIYVTMALAALVVLTAVGSHGLLLTRSRTRIVLDSFLAALVGVSLVALVLFAVKSPYWSRLFIFSFGIFGAIGLSIYRLVLRHYFDIRNKAGYYAKNVLLIGSPAAIAWMTSYFAESVPTTEYRLLGYLLVDGPVVRIGKLVPEMVEIACLGEAGELGDLLIHRPIHEVIAVDSSQNGNWIEKVVQDCDYLGVLLRIVPETLLTGRRNLRTLYPFAALHLPAVVLAPPHMDSDALFVKRVIDIVVSGLLLILLSPIFLLIALAIKLTTPNLPIFYPWRVVGQNGVEFTGYKFSTMVANADQVKNALMDRNEMSGPVFKIQDDPRVTPLGRFLRKYSLNELPQLWSVFNGDMSLVGPRPAFRHELDRYEFWQKRKLSIRPGITCLWQIRGRNKISNFDDWVRMDLEYIDNWSPWLDFKILLRTAWVVVAGTGS